ncbi:MAG: hypothetical protein HZC28_11825 [Spirochaetes bacterium]|nr:hypothetical protein [Spirochaetota bacterium]
MKTRAIAPGVRCSIFESDTGVSEYYLVIESRPESIFSKTLSEMYTQYTDALKEMGLAESTLCFARVYLSDIENQKKEVIVSPLFNSLSIGTCSLKEQAPLESGDLTLFAYHIKGVNSPITNEKYNFDDQYFGYGTKFIGKNYNLYYTANFSGWGELNSYIQTSKIFSMYTRFLHDNKMTLMNNTVRTWIYVRDIDNNYHGMVSARKDFFEAQGLTKETRYIASTGIESINTNPDALVSLDALSISNLDPKQIVRMEAPANMCPTHCYGVTFERGSRIDFGDRSHFHISGTASIDNKGDVMYIGDIKKQTERTLDNIEALLTEQQATIDDMAYLIVYLRNNAHCQFVSEVIKKRLKSPIPIVMVNGAVCRPTWLVEMEGVGIKKQATSFPAFF